LASIALFPDGGFAAFHDLITVTVWTTNWHEYQGTPLLAEGISMADMPEKIQM